MAKKPTGRKTRKKVKVEGIWECSSCGHINDGRRIQCEACGSPKEAETEERDQLPAGNLEDRVVADPELREQFDAGPHWKCDHCGSMRRAPDGSCGNCGAGKPKPKPERQRRPPPRIERRVYRGPRSSRSYGRSNPLAKIGIVLAVIAAVALIVFLLWPREDTATVASTSWTRTAKLFEKKIHTAEGWRKDAPGNAYDFGCKKRERAGTRCNPHDCNPHKVEYSCPPCREENCRIDRSSCVADGAGGFDCNEVCDEVCETCERTEYDTCYNPCIEEYCGYKYDSWPLKDQNTLSGNGKNVRWPSLSAGFNQRLDRSESYSVKLTRSGGKTCSHSPGSESAYKKCTIGDHWNVDYNLLGGCSPTSRINP